LRTIFRWIFSLFFVEGLPFAFVTTVSVVLFKNFGWSNTAIAFYTSLFTLPWFLKPFFAPLLAQLMTKRQFVLLMPCATSVLILLLAFFLKSNFYLCLILFFIIAFCSSIYDINADGIYLTLLDRKSQAKYVGFGTFAYQSGKLAAQGGLIGFTSLFFNSLGIYKSWQLALIVLALFLLLMSYYHYYIVPKEDTNHLNTNRKISLLHYKEVYLNFLQLPHVLHLSIFTLIFLLSENQLMKIVPLFLMDIKEHGGLNFTTGSVSILLGEVGVGGFLCGALLSGVLLNNMRFSTYVIACAILSLIVNLSYIGLSMTLYHSFFIMACVIFIAQFLYGMSNSAYMLFIFQHFGKGQHAMSLYAVGTAILGLGMSGAGAISGYMQWLLNYTGFFVWIAVSQVLVVAYSYFLLKKDIITC